MAAFAKFWVVVSYKQDVDLDMLCKFTTEKEARECAENCAHMHKSADYYLLEVVAKCSASTVHWDEATIGPAPF